MPFTRFPDPTNNISNLANQPVESAAVLKQKFDQVGEDLKDWNNNMFLPELESTTDGDSGLDNIGMTPIVGLVATTPQQALEEIVAKTPINVLDGSITDLKLSNAPADLKQRFANLKIVNVLDFGAVGNGITDDSVAFSLAIAHAQATNKNTICIPYTTDSYFIGNTVNLPSNIRIIGNNSVIQAKRNVGSTGGNYPTLIFRNSDFIGGNSNIEIEGIVFRGIWKNDVGTIISSSISVASPSNESNLLRFEKVENINMINCTIENHISNYGSSDDGFSSMHTTDCVNCYYENLKHLDSYGEAMNWVDCTNVRLENFYSKNSEAWSSVKFWYCIGVKLNNSDINEDFLNLGTGSIITTFSKNFVAENTNFKGGTHINLANERNEKAFDVDTVVFSNCTIETSNSGFSHSGGYLGNNYKSVKVLGSDIKSKFYGVTAKTDFLLVDDCTIETTDKSSEAVLNIDCKSSLVTNCKLKTGCGVKTTIQLVVTEVDLISVTNNVIELLNLDGADSYLGYGTAMNVRNAAGLVAQSNIKSVVFSDNIVTNANGGFVTYMIDSPNLMNIENFTIKDNVFKGGTSGAIRAFTIQKSGKLVLENNVCNDIGSSVLFNLNSFTIKDNYMVNVLSSIARASTFTLSGTFNDSLIIEDNIDKNSTNIINKGTATVTPTVIRNQNNFPKSNIGLESTKYGTTANRPTVKGVGDFYYDVTINKAIWWNGASWVDSTGTAV